MKVRRTILFLLCLLALATAWFFWPRATRPALEQKNLISSVPPISTPAPAATNNETVAENSGRPSAASTNRFAFRLANTPKKIDQLMLQNHAILLENAFVDTDAKLDLSIPQHLRASGEPGAYIVQARGQIDAGFRALLASSGAEIISYIPNNAYLVQLSGAGANLLAGNPGVQAVLPYEPYYKVQSSLLGLAVNQKPLPDGTFLTLGIYNRGAEQTLAQIEKLGGEILTQDRSPFGKMVRVRPPADWISLAQLPGVHLVEPAHRRVAANDLTRVALGVAVNTVTNANYLGLSGSNVLVEVNDSGIDFTHPDLTGRVFYNFADSGVDTLGHGTHVAGIIAGNGSKSSTINGANAPSGSVTNANFRGMAPLAGLFSVGFLGANDTNVFIGDSYLQEAPALTNALISNNSWANGGDFEYDLSAASFDAATRDSLPKITGSQPVLFVFAAGNDGNGNNGGGGGTSDSISSPGTGKNVITVGALEQNRNITNIVTALDGTSNAVWSPETDSSSQVAWFSARGNVGIGTEGTFGRFKPDVVAPGTFVVSTRSANWDQIAYYDPTNVYENFAFDQIVNTNSPNYYSFSDFGFVVKSNTVRLEIQILPPALSITPFPTNMPIYVSLNNFPDPSSPATYDFVTTKNNVTIPPDGPGNYLGNIINNFGDFNFAIGDSTNTHVNYDLRLELVTTNDLGNYYSVLSNLNNTLGPYYRYETGTSMAAPSVSGVLALMQDFFTNTLHTIPSPALLKAMLINGARPTGFYNLQVNNTINLEGWGLVNLPNSIPSSLTNLIKGATNSFYFIDQSPTNALATGDARLYQISLNSGARALPLRLTLTWTDPPGNPAAAFKLVNNLDLIVTNTDNPTNPVVYYGNDITANHVFNAQENPTNFFNRDAVNNVENVFLPANAGTNFTIVIYGSSVNVNAVTTQTNNAIGIFAPDIVQDFALVVSSGNGSNTNGFSITSAPSISNPTSDQRITIVTGTNASPLLNQFVGASSPLLGTNSASFGTNIYGQPALVTIGMTNQWHFYIVTNYGQASDFTNAAFITYLPNTLSLPREGVFAGSDANSTRPEADIELYVSTDSSLTNLNPIVISNCINSVQAGASVGGVFNGGSLGRGGSEFIVDTNSKPGQLYYVGVQSADQMASEYEFLSEFSNIPFSQMNSNGDETVNFHQVSIPDGDSTHPGFTNSVGLAIFPIDIQRVIATNILTQQNHGDLVVGLEHPTVARGNSVVVLLSHDSPDAAGTYTNIYDDSGRGDVPNSQRSDGPGSLSTYTGQQGQGIWILHAADNAPSFSGSVSGTLFIEKHHDLTQRPFVTTSVQPGTWFFDFIDVPVGYTNLLVVATNLPPTSVPPIQLYLNNGIEPTFSNFLAHVDLTNSIPAYPAGLDPGNSISYGPPLAPGRYFVGLFNPDSVSHDVLLGASLAFNASAITTINYDSTGPLALLDDAVTTDSIFVTNTDLIQGFNVGLRVDHPRISDLVFHLISPNGTRYLLMENRGNTSTNGAGITVVTTNIINQISNGGSQADTNFINIGITSGTFPITYNFYTQPDQMTVYYGTNIIPANLIYDTGLTNNPPDPNQPSGPQNTLPNTITVSFPPAGVPANSTYLTIIINQFGNGATADAWTYTAGGVLTNYEYLTFTEDTNRTLTPIKFAAPPFVSVLQTNITVQTNITFLTNSSTLTLSSFETAAAGNYLTASTVDGWIVGTNQVSVVNDFTNALAGSRFMALAAGSISRTLTNTVGGTNILKFGYRGPGAIGFWQGDNTPNDSVGINHGVMTNGANFVAGKVNQAFNLNGSVQFSKVPAFTNLNSIGNRMTIDFWMFANISNKMNTIQGLVDTDHYGVEISFGFGGRLGVNLYVDTTAGSSLISTVNGGGIPVTSNQWHHIAGVYDSTKIQLYIDGQPAGNAASASGNLLPMLSTSYLGIGSDDGRTYCGCGGRYFWGLIDEVTLYKRDLSASEIKAIYNAGTAGKYDSAASYPQNLAKASVALGGTTNVFFGANTNWQTNSITYVATTNTTALKINGIQPGMLMDSFALTSFTAVTNIVTNTVIDIANLYYLPEQSLSPLIGTSPYGEWQLEVLDNRAGATNATLVSWQLQFIFANTNIPFSSIPVTNGLASTNTLAGGGLAWFTVNVPTNADFATNILLFATNLPVNLLFSTNAPPTTTNANDRVLFNDVTNGTVVFGTNILNSPTNIIPGRTYYLGVQNTNATPITFALEVDFHLNFPSSPILPAISNQVIIAGTTLVVTNTATDTNAGILFYNLFTSPPTSASIFTNGVITWATSINQPGSTNLFTTIVGNASTGRRATNFFTVTVLPLLFTNQPQTNVVFAGSLNWLVVNVPTNADFSTNILLFATNLPVNLLFTTNFPPATNVASVLLSNATNGFSVLGTNSVPTNFVPGGVYYLGVQNTNAFDVTYGVEVDFHYIVSPTPPLLGAISNQIIVAGTALTVTNGATDTNAGTLFYTLTTAPVTTATISTNGIITWFVPTNFPATNVLFTTVVSNSFTTLRATNFFTVTVLPLLFTNQPQTNVVVAGGLNWYAVNVPTNADYATNILLFATNLPVNLLFTTNFPPTTNGAFTLMSNATNGISILSTNSTPTNIVPGGVYYLGVQNTNAFDVTFGLRVDFHLLTGATTNPIVISSIVYTNIGGSNGFLLTWFAPSNDLFQVQWTPSLVPATWNTFTNIISYNTNFPATSTNAQFNFFDDGSQTGGFGSTRFYRLILLQATNSLTLPFQPNQTIAAPTTLTVTNTATDSNTKLTLNYSLSVAPAGAAISPNGIITWNVTTNVSGTINTFTTIVTDSGLPPLSATNTFTVTVSPQSVSITGALVMTNGFVQINWLAPTNYYFQVESTTNLAGTPILWTIYPSYIYSTNGIFSFLDTNVLTAMKFYRLLEFP